MAVIGIERLRRAGEVLRRDGAEDGAGRPDRSAVLAAAAEFRSAAAAGLDAWPVGLQADSVRVQFRLVRHGSPEATVRRLAGPDVAELRRELLAFVEAAERLDGLPRRPVTCPPSPTRARRRRRADRFPRSGSAVH